MTRVTRGLSTQRLEEYLISCPLEHERTGFQCQNQVANAPAIAVDSLGSDAACADCVVDLI